MKVSAAPPLALLLLPASAISAFVSPQAPTTRVLSTTTPLEATNKDAEKGRWGPAVTGVVLGWSLATRIASASVAPQVPAIVQPDGIFGGGGCPTTLIAAGAYIPEEGYASLDMSMPSYTVEERAPPKGSAQGYDASDDASDDATAPAASKKASKAKVAAEKEEAKARAYFRQQQLRAAKAAEQAAIKAEVDAGRAAARAAKEAARSN